MVKWSKYFGGEALTQQQINCGSLNNKVLISFLQQRYRSFHIGCLHVTTRVAYEITTSLMLDVTWLIVVCKNVGLSIFHNMGFLLILEILGWRTYKVRNGGLGNWKSWTCWVPCGRVIRIVYNCLWLFKAQLGFKIELWKWKASTKRKRLASEFKMASL